ncbi:MAG: TolC family protein [Candidatus Eremiobacteraeota bacterium]|nr:TolC family protein [Candidatus Eremiobacteraeota bacterium]
MIVTIALATLPVFAQLSLVDAQQRAIANNVDVQTARQMVRQRQADLHLARIAAIPHLVGDYSLAPQAGPLDVGTVEQHYFAVGAGVSINDIVASSSAVRAAADELLAAQRSADAAELAARENAAKLYFGALQAIAVDRIRSDSVRGAERDRAAADLRVRSGESPQLDVVRADVTLAQARAEAARARSERANAVDALATATAVDPVRLENLTPELMPGAQPPDVDRAVARALLVRPELAALLATLEARNADVAKARQAGLPVATIEGGYQKGVDTGIPVQGPQVTAHLDVPLASESVDRVASAQAQVDTAYAQLADQRRRIALEVAAAVRDARAEAVATLAADTARDEARRALDAVEIGYREGASSSLDLAQARRTYEQASVDALVAEYQRALALATLEVIIP